MNELLTNLFWIISLSICVLVFGKLFYDFFIKTPSSKSVKCNVSNIVDGDTIEVILNNKKIRVRLTGIDTPELYDKNRRITSDGQIAKDILTKILCDKVVYLEFDENKKDKYNRFLCYVFLEDGTLVNLLLLQKGIAKTMICKPNIQYQIMFENAERYAKENKIGLWKNEEYETEK